MATIGTHVPLRWRRKAVAVAIACLYAASQAQANGTAPTVVAGQASFATQGGALSIVNSPGTIINWQGFSIGASESTRFIQQSAASSVLNRVIGPDPSVILGTLASNGRVFLINPSGILVGQGARIDVAGLVASTLNLSNQDFLAGRLDFAANPLAGKVHNLGHITTPSGGSVYLVGAEVANSGIIDSPHGDVVLAAGQSVTILDSSTPGVRVAVTASDNAAVNLGEILAHSGEVGIYGALLRNAGIIDADQVVRNASGKIVLQAKQDISLESNSRLSANGAQGGTITLQSASGTTRVSGTVEARGTDAAAGQGGTVQLLGQQVGIATASIDVSGTSGGGTLLVGGDYQGRNGAVQNAWRTYVGADVTIMADAIVRGDGGKVIVWADDFTRFQGNISARGGALAGNGGLVETSGHLNLEVLGGSVTTSATHGQAGTWLLDPSNVDITAGATTGTFDGGSPTNVFAPNQNTAVLNAGTLADALANGNVNITTSNADGSQAGTITVSAPVTRSAGSGTTTLTLTPNQVSGGTITIASGGDISGSSAHPLNVVLAANGVGATVSVGAPITTFGGNFSSTGTTFTNAAGAITTAGGTIGIDHGTTVTLAAPLASGGGNIVIAGGSTFTDTTTINAGSGSLTLQGSSDTLAIGVGSTSGTFNITQAQIANMTTTGGLIIGRSSGTAAMHIGTNEVVDFGSKNVTLQQAAGGMTVEGATVSGAIAGSGTVSFIAGTGAFTANQVINTSGAVNIAADHVAINANIAGNGMLTIAPYTAATAIQVGVAPTRIDFGGGSFITDSIGARERTLQIGTSANTGGITVSGAFNPGFATLALVSGGAIDIPVAANTLTASNILIAGSHFRNTGAAAIGTPGGRWLVYSSDPAGDVKGDLGYDFKHYGLAYNGTAYAGPGTGNGFIYSIAPTLTPALSGTTAKTYDGTPAASLVAANFTAGGALDGDTVVLANPAGGFYADPNVGTGKSVTASAPSSLTGASNGVATVYGYLIAATPASGNIGTITESSLTGVAANAEVKTYDGLAFSGGNGVTYSGFRNDDGPASLVGTLVYGGSAQGAIDVGNYLITPSGQSSPNYIITYVSGTLGITPAPLGIAANSATRLYGDANPAFSATYTGFRNGDTSAALTGSLTLVSPAVPTSSVGNYAIVPSGQSSTNYSIAYVTGTLGVTPAPLGIAANGATRLYGDANPVFGATYSGFKNGETAAALSGALTLATPALASSNVGNYAIVASGQSSTNYSIAYVAGTLGVTPAPLGIGANSATRLYGDANPAFSATYSGLKNSDTAAALTGSLTLVSPAVPTSNVGNYAIVPGGQSSTNYSIAHVNGTLGVTPAPLGIAANGATRLYGDANPAFSATYSGFKNGETAAVLSGTLALASPAVPTSNVGSYAIVASGQSATNYSIAYVAGTLGITPAPLGIAANGATRLYGDANPVFSATYSGLKNGDTAAALTGSLALVSPAVPTANVGNYAIVPSGQSSANYSIAYVNGTLGVTPAPLGIAANGATRIYGDANPAFSATYSGFKNGETVAALSGALAFTTPAVPDSDVGSYAIVPSGLSSTNYSIAYVPGTLGVTAAGLLGISANAVAKTYDGLPFSGGNGVTYSGFQGSDTAASLSGTLTYDGSSQGAIDVGTYLIVPSGQSSPNYTITYVNGTLGVTPAPLGIAANSATRLYGEANPAFSATYSGFKNGETAAVLSGSLAFATSAVPNSNVGSYAIVPSGQSAANYSITYVAGALGVTPAPLGIAANSATRLYGEANPALSATYSGFRNGETAAALSGSLALLTSAVPTSNVGSYAIVPGGQSATNYNIAYVAGTLGVTPAPLGIAANSATRLYGDANPAFAATYTGLKNGETAAALDGVPAFATPAVPSSNVGNYAIVASGQSSPNYSIAYVAGTLGVTPAPLGIAANSATRLYGDANPALSATYTGLKNGETAAALAGALALLTPAVPGSNVGNYAIVASGQSSTNYSIAYVDGTLGVTPAPLGIAANGATRLYGDANPAFSATYTGLKNGDTAAALSGALALLTPAVPTSNVGSYAIVASGQSATNYTIAYVDGTLGVTPAPLGIAANGATRLYGDANPAFDATYSGFKNGETAAALGGALALATAAVPGSNVGNYAIVASGRNSTNYDISYVDGTLGVTPAPLGIAANSTTRLYGDANPAFAATYTGLKNGETATALGGALSLTTAALATSNVGNYAIVASGQSSPNYSIAYVDGTLGVTPAPLGIAANSATRLYGDANPAFGATYSGFKNGETAAVLSGTLAFATPAVPTFNVGNYAIVASGQSSPNYSIAYVAGTLGVTPAPLGIVANSATRLYGDANPAFGVGYTGFKNGETAAALGGALAFATPAVPNSSVGDYAIVASGQSSANYHIAYVDGTLGVTPAPLGIVANSATRLYGDANPAFGATYSGFKNGETAAALGGSLAFATPAVPTSSVGSYAIVPSGQSATNYSIAYVAGTLGVTPAPLGIAANSTTRLYGDANPAFGATYSGFKNGETAAVLSGTLAFATPAVPGSNVGNYAIAASGQSSANYSVAYVDGTLGVTPASLGIAANSASRLYGDANPAFSATYSGFKNGETAAVLGGVLALATPAVATSNVGTYAIVSSGQSATNYSIVYVPGTLGVTPAPLGIAANSASRLYGDANPAFGATYSGFKNGETAAVLSGTLAFATPAVATSIVGHYPVTPSGQSATNYSIAYLDGTLGVTPAPLGIAANSTTRLYGDANPAFSATYSGFKNGETPAALSGTLSFTTPAAPISNVGDYAIVPSGQSATNYSITYVPATLDITPAPLSITANDATRSYGETNPTFTASYTGLRNADTAAALSGTLRLIAAAIPAANVGNYVIAASGQSSPNYTLRYADGTLSVVPAPLLVSADAKSKVVGSSDPALTFTTAGLVRKPELGVVDTAASVLAGALARTPGESVPGGPYAITQGSLTANGNYTVRYLPNWLVITAAPPQPLLAFGAGQAMFAGVMNIEHYYRPGNFWHISLNSNNADPGFDVMRGTNDLQSRLNDTLNACDSMSGGGICETWSFPQQRGKTDDR